MDRNIPRHSYRPGLIACLASSLIGFATLAMGQGVQLGTISGVVRSADRMTLPGVTVTATSQNLQGERTTVSDDNGVYYLRGLTPGTYDVTFSLSGFQSSTRTGLLVSAAITTLDALMSPAGVAEAVTVTASPGPVMAGVVTGQTFTKSDIDRLPVGRRPFDIAELAPGVTPNVFNAAQLTMGGSFGFDNVFMVNGVDVNDTVNGQWNDLYIEDAIQEVSVLSHGIPAEYGRFSGGVVNVVTRSGTNAFGGSFRDTMTNPTWIAETPLERQTGVTHVADLNAIYEGTFGGPILVDRLWFFGAGRYATTSAPRTFAMGGAGYTRTETNRRGEIKVTGSVAPGHVLQASFIGNATEQANTAGVSAGMLLDASTIYTRQLPNRLFVSSYNGVITPKLFATVQYSEKKQGFRNNGGTSRRLVDSPFITEGALTNVPGGLFYNAPYFDATDPEDRNNRQVTGSLSYLLSTTRMGTHDLKGGAEYFVSTGIGGNSQTSTGAVFFTDYVSSNGLPVLDANGTPIPVFTPGVSQVWTFDAVRGAKVDIKTRSLFAQDRWTVSPRLTIDLGARFESVRADATGDITTVDTSTIVPRLAAAYDVQGDGRTVLTATYGHYSGKYGQVPFSVNTNVGRPSEVDYGYTGPAGQGKGFAPGFDLANYSVVTYANFPTANVKVARDIRSPLTREFTFAAGRQLGPRADAKVTYVWRNASDFVEDFATLEGGVTNVPMVGPLTSRVYDNATADQLHRRYQALIVQSGFRPGRRVTIDGSYTLQLQNEGNFSGEGANRPGVPSVYGDFPEVFGPALDRLAPSGRLDNYQRHKLRVYGTYAQPLGKYGSLDLSPLWRVNSGGVYSLTTQIGIPAVQLARNPGYPINDLNPFVPETIYFGDRGHYDFKGFGVMDFAASYNLAVWRSVRPWVKLEIFNAFNNQKLISWNTSVAANPAQRDANGIPTGYVEGAKFGKATQGSNFPQPYPGQNGGRAFRVAFGVRF